jgi:hypothetical protein
MEEDVRAMRNKAIAVGQVFLNHFTGKKDDRAVVKDRVGVGRHGSRHRNGSVGACSVES